MQQMAMRFPRDMETCNLADCQRYSESDCDEPKIVKICSGTISLCPRSLDAEDEVDSMLFRRPGSIVLDPNAGTIGWLKPLNSSCGTAPLTTQIEHCFGFSARSSGTANKQPCSPRLLGERVYADEFAIGHMEVVGFRTRKVKRDAETSFLYTALQTIRTNKKISQVLWNKYLSDFLLRYGYCTKG